MTDGGFLDTKPRSPGGLVIVIAAHAAVLSALAMARMETPISEILGPIQIKHIPEPREPPPIPPEPKVEPREAPQHKSVITRPDSIVKTDTKPIFDLPKEKPVDISRVTMSRSS